MSIFGPRPGVLNNRRNRHLPKVFVEVFDGDGTLGSAVKARGWEVRGLDVLRSPNQDLLNDDVFIGLVSDLLNEKVGGIHVAFPCDTLSIMTRQPKLRGNDCIVEGLPNLSAQQREKLDRANEPIRRGCILLNIAYSLGLLASFENPRSSMLWKHEAIICLMWDWCLFKAIHDSSLYVRGVIPKSNWDSRELRSIDDPTEVRSIS